MPWSAVLLAGGKSRRMGRDKAFVEWEGEPLWRRQLATLRGLSPNELFVAGPPRPEWRDCQVIADAVNDAGPLGGVAAALRKCATPLLVVLAIDLPRLTTAFLQSLLDRSDDGKGVVPRIENRFEPLAAIYPRGCSSLAEAALRREDFSMQHFVEAAIAEQLLATREISKEEKPLFTNLNSPADL